MRLQPVGSLSVSISLRLHVCALLRIYAASL